MAGRRPGPARGLLGLGGEPVHLPAVQVSLERLLGVRVVPVAVVMVGPRLAAATISRVGHAHPRRNAIGSRERAEVRIEGPVLLHDDDHVLDQVNASMLAGSAGPRRAHIDCTVRWVELGIPEQRVPDVPDADSNAALNVCAFALIATASRSST